MSRIPRNFAGRPLLRAVSLLLISHETFAVGPINNGEVSVNVAADQVIELEAVAAPLDRVIDRLAEKLGIPVHYSVLPAQPVTATCAGIAIKDVMACLLGPKVDLVFRYPASAAEGGVSSLPAEIWILGSSLAPRRSEVDASCSSEDSQRGGAESPRLEADIGYDPKKKSAERATRKRATAIARLAADKHADPGEVVRSLEAALVDPDAEVRAQAVYGLARRGGDLAAPTLRTAMGDADPSVRLMAVDSAGSDPEGLALLRDALADSDETVSALAALKLESAANP